MKSCSIVAAPAVGLLVLACAWPASAGTMDGQAARYAGQVRGHRTALGVATRHAKPEQRSMAAPANADASASATASSTGGTGVGSQGQSMTVDNHARAAPSPAIAPALTGSNDTCMGSASIGAAGMAFGLSLGTTYTDENCMMLKNARELWNMGFRGAAIARMCMDERNRQALETSGVPCPAAAGERTDAGVERERNESSIREAVSSRGERVR